MPEKDDYIKPDVVLNLTEEQRELISPLIQKVFNEGGMILGSAHRMDKVITLSYIPANVAESIITIAKHYFDKEDSKNAE